MSDTLVLRLVSCTGSGGQNKDTLFRLPVSGLVQKIHVSMEKFVLAAETRITSGPALASSNPMWPYGCCGFVETTTISKWQLCFG